LKLKCDEQLSDFAFTFNLPRYTPVVGAETLARVIRCVEAVFQRVSVLRSPALLPPPLLHAAGKENQNQSPAGSADSGNSGDAEAGAYTRPLLGST